MHRVKQQLNVTYSSSEEDDDFSSARNVSVAESNESIDKPDESSNDDSPFNNFVRTKSRKQIIYSDDSDEFSFGSRHSTNASGEFSGQHSRIDNVSFFFFFGLFLYPSQMKIFNSNEYLFCDKREPTDRRTFCLRIVEI